MSNKVLQIILLVSTISNQYGLRLTVRHSMAYVHIVTGVALYAFQLARVFVCVSVFVCVCGTINTL